MASVEKAAGGSTASLEAVLEELRQIKSSMTDLERRIQCAVTEITARAQAPEPGHTANEGSTKAQSALPAPAVAIVSAPKVSEAQSPAPAIEACGASTTAKIPS